MTTNVDMKALEQLRTEIDDLSKEASLLSNSKAKRECYELIAQKAIQLKSMVEEASASLKAEIEAIQKPMDGLDIKPALEALGGSYSTELGRATLTYSNPVNMGQLGTDMPGFMRDPARFTALSSYLKPDMKGLKASLKLAGDANAAIRKEAYEVFKNYECQQVLGQRYYLN